MDLSTVSKSKYDLVQWLISLFWAKLYKIVYFQTFGRSATFDGNVQGFCFSPTFGGRCSGIPKGCSPCNLAQLCQDRGGQQFSVEGTVSEGKLIIVLTPPS